MEACDTGVAYLFVNNADDDNGIVVQHVGGIFGAGGLPQFGVINCFCYTGSKLLCAQR